MSSAAAGMSIVEARQEFDVHPGYLDTATIGVPPRATAKAMTNAIVAWQTGRARPKDYDPSVARSRALFAQLMGTDVEDVCVGSQVSSLVAMIASALPDGARVLGVEGDFTSAFFPFMAHADRGISVTLVPLDRLAASIDASTSLVVFSAVQSADGRIADLPAIAAAAARHGARTVADTTQACGWLPIDATRFDATVCHAYKWLFSPRGAAFMTVRPDFLATIRPVAAGWYAGDDVWSSIYGAPLRLARTARRLDVSPAWFSWTGTEISLDLIARVGVEAIRDHDVALANRVRAALGLPASESSVVRIESDDAPARLAAADIRASSRAGAVRVGFHLYNTTDDADRLIEALGPMRSS